MSEANIEIVKKYLNALKRKDLSSDLFAEELEFEDPIAGKGKGVENLNAFLTGFLSAINDLKIHQHICENDTVVTHFEIDTVFGIIPVLELFRLRDGKIFEIRAFYNPAPVLGF